MGVAITFSLNRTRTRKRAEKDIEMKQLSSQKTPESICLQCDRPSCDAGQHSGCAFMESFGKDKTPQYLRQDSCGFEDPYQRALRKYEADKKYNARRKRT